MCLIVGNYVKLIDVGKILIHELEQLIDCGELCGVS